MLVDIGLKFVVVVFLQYHHGLPWVTLRSRSQTFCVKILVNFFISRYLLNMLMDQVDRYWSQVVCCTIMTHLSDLDVKVTELGILC